MDENTQPMTIPQPTRNQRMVVLRNLLSNFMYSLSSGLSAQSQAHGSAKQKSQAGMGAALQAPFAREEQQRQAGIQQQQLEMQRQQMDMQRADQQFRAKQFAQEMLRGNQANALALFNATNGQAMAPEVTVPNAPTMNATGELQPTAGTRQVPMPLPPIQYPTGEGSSMPLTRMSGQQFAQQQADRLRQQKEIESEFRPDKFISTPMGVFDTQSKQFIKGGAPVNPANLQQKEIDDPDKPGQPLLANFNPDTGVTTHPATGKVISNPKSYVRKDDSIAAMRELQATLLKMQLNSGGLTMSQRANEISTMRNQWTKAIQPIVDRRQATAKLDTGLQALKNGNRNAATQIIVTAFNKLQDETSVVREGEYARSEQGQAVTARIQGAIDRISKGGSNLTDADLTGLANEAKNIATALEQVNGQTLGSMRKSIEATLDDYKIPHDRVFGDSDLGKAKADTGGYDAFGKKKGG